MRFLLVNPFYPVAEIPSPPLGISYLAGALERVGVEVRVLDLVVTACDRSKLERILSDFQPDIVGATSVTMTFDSAISVIRSVKQIDPSIMTAMGGAHVSFCAEATMTRHPELDLVGLGEGEETIVDIVRAFESGRDFGKVPGIAYRDGDTIRNTGARGYWIDVDTLPLPSRHLVPLGRYRALDLPISMTTSRGCPFQCIFCTGRQLVGAKIRYRQAKSVVDEMEQVAALGFKRLNLADDLFTARKDHAHAVCDEILRRGLEVTWTSFSNVNTVDVPLLRKMKEAGCILVSFGLESANADILKTVKKGTKIPKIIEAVEMCNEAGVQPHGSFIVGLPGETPETLRQLHEFSRKLAEMGCETGVHMLAPFPGTAVYEQREKYGIRLLTDDWSQFHANHAITEQDSASHALQEAIAMEMEERAKSRFWEMADRVKNGTASAEDRETYARVERHGVYYEMMMQDLLETDGSWDCDRHGRSATEVVAELGARVHARTGQKPDAIARALDHALREGFLRYGISGSRCTWSWVDDGPTACRSSRVEAPGDRAVDVSAQAVAAPA
jgi:anaerobic magnesium-protoporphyrin IX monomethyl ester cyclase